jgi:hypothetical protein
MAWCLTEHRENFTLPFYHMAIATNTGVNRMTRRLKGNMREGETEGGQSLRLPWLCASIAFVTGHDKEERWAGCEEHIFGGSSIYRLPSSLNADNRFLWNVSNYLPDYTVPCQMWLRVYYPYRDLPVSAALRNNDCLFRESYETHEHALCWKILNVKAVRTILKGIAAIRILLKVRRGWGSQKIFSKGNV